MTAIASRGKILSDQLRESLRIVQRGPVSSDRNRPIIWGITHYGAFVHDMTIDGFLAQSGRILNECGYFYRWEDTLVYEYREPDHERLLLLATQTKAEPCAGAIVANFVGIGTRDEDRMVQSLMPDKLVKALLLDEDLWRRLPVIRHYARRPIFDAQFHLCSPGWNAERGILIHGPDILPEVAGPKFAVNAPVLDRLPPYTRRLFAEFCWASDADLTNAVSVLLTGILGNHFLDDPKPIVIIDGNQRGLGKTLFCQAMGRVLDGVEPRRLPLVRDDELEKKLSAFLKESESSILFFDNVRTRIESALIEANALSPVLSFRILGQSGNITRPNTFLWVITSNQTSGSEDLISRGLPVRLRYEGNPRERHFRENLLEYVSRYRLQILGEMAGMVYRWKQAGKPLGGQQHRCVKWAQVIGGILQVAGFDQFLANLDEVEEAMDEGVQALCTLAEHVFSRGLRSFYCTGTTPTDGIRGMLAREWTPLFLEAEVFKDKLADKNGKGRDTLVGTFLTAKTDRKVTIQTMLGSATAVLRTMVMGNRQKRYWFEITPDPTTDSPSDDGTAGKLAAKSTTVGTCDLAVSAPPPAVDARPVGESDVFSLPPMTQQGAGVLEGNDLDW